MKDMSGIKFNNYTVVEFSHRKGKNYYWKCICDCGNKGVLQIQTIKASRSCKKCQHKLLEIHGLNGNPIYHVLQAMKNRCYNISNKSYSRYGSRGISICDEWLNDPSAFVNWSMDNGYESGLSIDRINNDGNYTPENCRWVTKDVQSYNTSANVWIEFKGERMTVCQWADVLGMKRPTLVYRLRSGWSIERALTEPVVSKV